MAADDSGESETKKDPEMLKSLPRCFCLWALKTSATGQLCGPALCSNLCVTISTLYIPRQKRPELVHPLLLAHGLPQFKKKKKKKNLEAVTFLFFYLFIYFFNPKGKLQIGSLLLIAKWRSLFPSVIKLKGSLAPVD